MVQLGADFPLKGSGYQEIHRDHSPLFGEDGPPTPLYALAVNIPLVDVTDENGPLEAARATHFMKKSDGVARIESGELPMERFYVRKGDVIIRTPLHLHRGTPNNTDTWRPMVVMGYTATWLRTDHLSLQVPRSYYETLDEPTRKLLRCQLTDTEPALCQTETYLKFKY